MAIYLFLALLVISLFFSMFIFAGKTAEKASKKSYELKNWIDGPVRYLATFNETKEFKSLRTDRERNHFIYKFWQRRDPSPLTIKNEFREQYWERVIYTNQMFEESTKPGWMTDRGKIYIMAGPPNQKEYIDNPDASISMDDMRSMGSSGHRGIERWTYQGLPGVKGSPLIVVAFYKDATGEFKLSYNPDHFDEVAPGLIAQSERYPDPADFDIEGTSAASPNQGQMQSEDDRERMRVFTEQSEEIEKFKAITQFQFDLAEITDTPQEEDLLKERVTTFEFYEPASKNITTSVFQDINGQPYLNISVQANLKNYYKGEIPDKTVLPLSLFGNLRDVANPQNEFLFTSDHFVPNHLVRDRDEVRLTSSLTIPPGIYNAVVGIQELLGGKISIFSNRIEIPSFKKDEITMSDIVLASRIEETGRSTASSLSPIPGNLKVSQKVNAVYRKNEEFVIYFQIYEAVKSPATGKPDLEISYQFHIWRNNAFQKIGKPLVLKNIDTQERGRSFPLEKWPSGKFKIEITVKDSVTGLTHTKEASFDVID
ncbi:MAG: GWxTD domain-containing protein [Acidobacteriota bacterium]